MPAVTSTLGSARTSDSAPPLLTLAGASKTFGGVAALRDVSLELYPGEVHAIVGENGAGKSTLIKILSGVHQPDTGTLTIDGEQVFLTGTAASSEHGIAVIYQEPTMFPDLTVAENVFIGRQPLRPGRRIDHRAMSREVEEVFTRLGVVIDAERIARGLSIAEQQLVEIAKALTRSARILIMDEPTAALSPVEVQRLFRVVESLRSQGCAVVFISHRLDEVYEICQRVTVLRDGTLITTGMLADMSEPELVRAMVGRDVELGTHEHREAGKTVLEVERLTREGVFRDISFEVKSGEVVALAGLVGSGRTEVAQAIFGVERADAGTVTIKGRKLKGGSPTAAMDAGIGLVPEDRRQQGLVLDISIAKNIALGSLKALRKAGLIRPSAEQRFGEQWAKQLTVKYSNVNLPVGTLSGGNQQKVVLAKWLARHPSLLIVDEPTRGIDIGAKREVHDLISRLADDGIAVLVISSELPEVLTLADRILVMREGQIAARLTAEEATQEKIVAAAVGSGASPIDEPSASQPADAGAAPGGEPPVSRPSDRDLDSSTTTPEEGA